MRGVVIATLVIATLAVVACFGAGSSAASPTAGPSTQLRITYWPEGAGEGTSRTWTLTCDPAGGTLGTLAREQNACRRLAALRNPFARPSPDLMCTQQYGGPDQALITGTYRGRGVWVGLGLTDGCQIARFRKLGFLIPAFS